MDLSDPLMSRDELRSKFGILNYVVFIIMLLVSAMIGVYYWWRGQKNTEEFLLASRSMNTLPMTLSLVASFMSAITLLGVPAEIYTAGTQFVMSIVVYPLVMGIVIHYFLPVYDGLKLTTSYQYLELRFNSCIRIFASILFSVQMLLYMAIVVYAPSIALIQVTGFLHDIDYDVEVACAIIYAVCIFYSCVGGIKAVIWTDCFQSLCMFGSYLGIIIYGSQRLGGAARVFDLNYQAGRVELFSLDPDPRQRHTLWGLLVGTLVLWVSVYGTNQAMVQRYSTVRKRSQVVNSLWLNGLLMAGLVGLCSYGGMVMFAFYRDCDPFTAGQVETKDQMFPLFVMQMVGDIPGLPGLFVAGVFSGALSTVSSGLNSLSAVFITDLLQLGCKVEISENTRTVISKLISLVFGLLSFGIVFLMKYLPGVLQAAIGLFGMVGGPLLGVFSLGMFVPFANSAGALTGLLISLVFVLWMGLGQIVARQKETFDAASFAPMMNTSTADCPAAWISSDTADSNTTLVSSSVVHYSNFNHLGLYDISYLWYGPISLLICVVIGVLVSLTRPRDHTKLDSRLVSPTTPTIFFWLPRSLRVRLSKYFQEIGSLYSESEDEQTGDVFGKNGAINVAYMPSSSLTLPAVKEGEVNTSNISTYNLHVMGDA